MRKLLSGILLLSTAAAASTAFGTTQDKKNRGKTPELTKKYVEQMKENAKAMKALAEDIEKGKPEEELKKHLAKIKENVTKARELKYRKDEDEAEKLEGHFDIFLFKLKQDFQDVEWGDKEKRLYLHERLQAKCDVCHETLRDD